MSPRKAAPLILTSMPVMERLRDRGARRARTLARSIGEQLLEARLAAGLSQTQVA